jgi:hypothetical protein
MPYAYCTEVLVLFKAISMGRFSDILEDTLANLAA